MSDVCFCAANITRQEWDRLPCFTRRNGIRDLMSYPWGHKDSEQKSKDESRHLIDSQMLSDIRDHPVGPSGARSCVAVVFCLSKSGTSFLYPRFPHCQHLRICRPSLRWQKGRRQIVLGVPASLPQAACHPFSISNSVSLF